tara:strand:- start:37 stop:603 length:567 start_codon:yes stop_codon:yes gene_type:complete
MAATIPTNGIVLNSGLNVADGDITIASGHGINFAATSDASGSSSELLDDYEEGTFTFAIQDGSGNAVTMNTGYDDGQYTKVGNRVHAHGYAVVTSIGSASGNMILTGLPYTVGNSNHYYVALNIGYFSNMKAANSNVFQGVTMGGFVSVNNTQATLSTTDQDGGMSTLQADEINNSNFNMMWEVNYRV